MDSYFEYLLKSFILFNEVEDLETFQSSYETIKTYLRKGYLAQLLISTSSFKLGNTINSNFKAAKM